MTQTQLKAGKRQRDPFFDNARFILVALVVLGHLISPVREGNGALFFANNFLTSFRMPALILLTGFFTKHFCREPKRYIKKLLIGIFIPYLLFQIFYLRMDGLAENGEQLMANLFAPNFGMWFLLSLLAWNLLLFPFSKLKHPILTAFFIGTAIGWVDWAGEYLSISRTFVFFPLFLIGHYLQREQMEWFKKKKAKIAAVCSMAVSWMILSFFSLEQARNALLARQPYAEIAGSALEGTAIRLVFYGLMFLGILSFLPWVPKKEFAFTYLGRRTAYVYLLHLFFIKVFTGIDLFPSEPGIWFFVALPVVWLAIVFWTSSNAVVFFAKPAVEGKFAALLLQGSPSVMNTINQLTWLAHKK
ncbi:acyltransferase family protein [Planococcus shenhongbingii]|uniref:acyltransferase family protein n=1 Tax=Planococcus shenhongbingii TaxID=3058398 RepID=UPI00262D9E73|nr:acyltransferase family protein [Planococcus sp. N016]WKA58244.1 acyltransferase family protein [Planococcus sp. N016]